MASKGRKFNHYTSEFKNEIVSQHLNENKSMVILLKFTVFQKGQ
ncbi:MAG: hypothetical protein ACI4TT_03975 [Christensenellales bacterium]